jgi:hypothetical protein
LQVFCDSDYVGCADTRRSTTGYVFCIDGAAISWNSQLQHTVARSTAEAEFMAAAAVVRDAMWFKKLAADLEWDLGGVPIQCDNQAALHLLHNPVVSQRAKHIDIIYLYAREKVALQEVSFTYCASEENVADIMTKPLGKYMHERHSVSLGLM